MCKDRGYPEPRMRAVGALPAAALKYERVDGPTAEITCADTEAEVFRFSGRPDTIFLSARSFPAIVVLTDRLNRERTTLLVPVNASIETFVARDTVRARNAIAGSAAIITVVGKWAELDEASSAY